MKRFFFLVVVAGALLEGRVMGGVLEDALENLPLVKVPHAADPPAIDGDADGPTWASAAVIHGLSPALGSKKDADRIAGLPTTIRLLWDEKYLYVAFDCRGGHPEADPAIKPGELLYMHSACEIFLDPVGDGREYMEFQFSSIGQSVSVVHLLTGPPQYTDQGRLVQAFSDREHWYYKEATLDGLKVVSGHASRGDPAAGWSLTVAIPSAPIMRRRGLYHFVPGELRANFARHEFVADPVTGVRKFVPQYWSPVLWGCPHISADLMGKVVLEP